MNASIKNNLKTFSWLVRREFWENKGLFLWVPVAVGIAYFLFDFLGNAYLAPVFNADKEAWIHFNHASKVMNELNRQVDLDNVARVNHDISQLSLACVHLLLITGACLASFYLLGSLHDDKRDRSILFWKSMPVSDGLTVLSKLVFPLILIPMINLGIAFIVYFFGALATAVFSIFTNHNLFVSIMTNSDLYQIPFQFLKLFPFYLLWSLPTVGWFLMVSSVAKSRVFPWAIGLPILSAIILVMSDVVFNFKWDSRWFVEQALSRWIVANIPGSWLIDMTPEEILEFGIVPGSAYATVHRLTNIAWGSASLWLGVVLGVAMILLAIRSRRSADVVN